MSFFLFTGAKLFSGCSQVLYHEGQYDSLLTALRVLATSKGSRRLRVLWAQELLAFSIRFWLMSRAGVGFIYLGVHFTSWIQLAFSGSSSLNQPGFGTEVTLLLQKKWMSKQLLFALLQVEYVYILYIYMIYIYDIYISYTYDMI